MINTQELFSLLYNANDCTKEQIENMYPKNGYYVFRRKKHDTNHYNAYLKANNNNASTLSLTCPAFPKYLLPPDNIIGELEKSPKLNLEEGFRKSNWNDLVGDFYCIIDDIDIDTTGNKKYLTYVDKFLLFMNNKNNNKSDEYIYSIYIIEKIDNLKYFCCFMTDITQKTDKKYSLKKDIYIQPIQPYTVTFSAEDKKILSLFGKN